MYIAGQLKSNWPYGRLCARKMSYQIRGDGSWREPQARHHCRHGCQVLSEPFVNQINHHDRNALFIKSILGSIELFLESRLLLGSVSVDASSCTIEVLLILDRNLTVSFLPYTDSLNKKTTNSAAKGIGVLNLYCWNHHCWWSKQAFKEDSIPPSRSVHAFENLSINESKRL